MLLVGLMLMPMIVGLMDVIQLGISVTCVIGHAVVNESVHCLYVSLTGVLAICCVNVVWKAMVATMTSTSVGVGLILLAVIRDVNVDQI